MRAPHALPFWQLGHLTFVQAILRRLLTIMLIDRDNFFRPYPTHLSLAKQDRDIAAVAIRCGQIGLGIIIEIPHRNGVRAGPRGKVLGRSERAGWNWNGKRRCHRLCRVHCNNTGPCSGTA